MTITGKSENGCLKVYFNGIPHLSFRLSTFVMFQSWKYSTAPPRFYVEYYFRDSVSILCEYDTEEKFRAVLAIVDEHLTFYQSLPE